MEKVLIIMSELKSGGAEKLCIDILKRFDYTKYEVTLLLIHRDGIYLDLIPQNVNVISIFDAGEGLPKICNARYLRNITRKLLLWAKLPKLKKFDTIISFMEGESLRYHALIRSRAKRNISWVHTDLKENHWSRMYFWDDKEECDAYKSMDSVIFVSEQARTAFHELYPAVDNLEVILNLIDTEEICKKASGEHIKHPGGFVICGVGRLVEQKRFDRFIDVVDELQRRGYPVSGWIIGDGYNRDNIQRHANKTRNVSLLGFKQNPLPYVKIADLFLSTSDKEGFSLVVAEAMSLGKPIVSTPVTGPKELLSGDAGVLTSFDPKEIADEIELLIRDCEVAEGYSQRAMQRSQMFDVVTTMNHIYSAISPR